MEGELVNDDDAVQAPISGHIFEAALAMLFVYHLVLRPLGLIEVGRRTTSICLSIVLD